jgi:hypothetical protein
MTLAPVEGRKQRRTEMRTAMETLRMDDIEWAPVGMAFTKDHRELSNDELHRLLCMKIPQMAKIHVTDEIRETVIAMIEISD